MNKEKEKRVVPDKVINISFDDFDYLGQDKSIYKMVMKEKDLNIEDPNSNEMTVHFNLDKLRHEPIEEIEKDELKKRLYLLLCGDEKLDEIFKDDEDMQEIIRELKRIEEETGESIYEKIEVRE